MPLAEPRAGVWRGDAQIVELQLVLGRDDEFDPARPVAELVDVDQRLAEGRDPEQGRAPVGDRAEIIDEPAQRLLHLIEGADHHHQFAERQVAGEKAGRGDDDRRDDREPAIAGGDPGQLRDAGDEPAHDGEHRIQLLVRGAASRPLRRRRGRCRRSCSLTRTSAERRSASRA